MSDLDLDVQLAGGCAAYQQFDPIYAGALDELDRISKNAQLVFDGRYGHAVELVAAIFDRDVAQVVGDLQAWRAPAVFSAPDRDPEIEAAWIRANEQRAQAWNDASGFAAEGASKRVGGRTEPYASDFGRCVR